MGNASGVASLQQKQATLQIQAQKDILKLGLKNINLNHLLLDQQRIDQALQKMEDTLSTFNDGMGLQVPQSIESNQNQEQSFLSKISNAFNRFEEVIQSLKRQLATQEEQSNHLSILFENEKREKQDKIRMYEIQIESIHENQLKTAKQQIHQLEKKLDDNIQESKTIIDELMKQNKSFQDQKSGLIVECDSLKNKIQDLEKERINAENKYEQLKQNGKNEYENQIVKLKCQVEHNQEERDHFQLMNQQLEEKNKRLERTIKDNQKEIEKLNQELRQLNEEINDIKKQMLIERQKFENKEKEIAQLKNGKAKLQNENHDLKMSLNLLQKEDRNFDQSYETQKSRDQSPFQQQGSNLKKSRKNSVTSLQKQSQVQQQKSIKQKLKEMNYQI